LYLGVINFDQEEWGGGEKVRRRGKKNVKDHQDNSWLTTSKEGMEIRVGTTAKKE